MVIFNSSGSLDSLPSSALPPRGEVIPAHWLELGRSREEERMRARGVSPLTSRCHLSLRRKVPARARATLSRLRYSRARDWPGAARVEAKSLEATICISIVSLVTRAASTRAHGRLGGSRSHALPPDHPHVNWLFSVINWLRILICLASLLFYKAFGRK